jgi:GT2 family glycosyltransferase
MIEMDAYSTQSQRIAVLLTCYNRSDKTLSCLRSLKSQVGLGVDIYLVDDGSEDGTPEAVVDEFPDVNLLRGDGALFWNGGMRMAFEAAVRKNYDYLLWLNDDTELVEGAINRLLSVGNAHPSSIIVGSTRDSEGKQHTYGGLKSGKGVFVLRFTQIVPDEDQVVSCDTFNGNCVLIPFCVFDSVGNLSPEFTHGMGDFDYGLRAKQAGFDILVAPGYYGRCDRNPVSSCFDSSISLKERWKALHTPKGLPPDEWTRFARKHAPFIWPAYAFKLYLRVLLGR